MRERSVACASQRGGARGGARTMARWLGATTLLATLATLHAWRPPPQPILLPQTISNIRIPRHTRNTIHHLHILGWHLELQENRAIRSPYYNQCQFYKGRILYEAESTVTVTECEGQLYGLLQVSGEDFVLQPNRPDSHVLRRRDVLVSEQPAVYNLTGDTVTDLDIEFEEDEPKIPSHVHTRQNHQSDLEYFRNMLPVSRPIAGGNGLWLELAIVADHTMVKFHGRERVKHYILAIMNIVSAIFNDHSLDSNMTLVINKLFLYEEKDSVIKYGNVKKSLEAVNKWNYRHLMKLPADSTGWDATVWLTRAQLGGPSGFAPVGGVCNKHRSAAIDRDEGLTSAFVIAHELGHLLGLTHDSDGQCESDGIRGSVMAPTVLATLHNYAWSSCSRQQFHEKSKKWWCLHERSRDDGVELGGAKELSNYVFTMDEQCRTEFGEGFSVCKSVKVRSPCAKLWCAHRSKTHVCHSKRAPPLEGTPCGTNQWCVDRVCEPMPEHAVENKTRTRNPQWGEWSPWSECNVNCGYGLRSRTRRCWDGGLISSSCEGAGSQMATCWTGTPCASTRDARSDACSRQGSHLIPHMHVEESNHCETWCVDYAGGNPSNYGPLNDGTPCSYEKPFDLCYQGTCVKGQCNATDPVCNWCPDGYCNNNTHIYTRQLGKGWTRLTVIPHEANQLSVYIATPVPLNIAIRERRRDRPILQLNKHSRIFEIDHRQYDLNKQGQDYLKYDVPQNLQIIDVDSNVIDIKERFGSEGEVAAAGSLLRWKQTESDVMITSNSRLQTDLMIMAVPTTASEDTIVTEVSVNYSTPAARTRPMEYRWSSERGPCSVSCGGGMRVVRPRCPRDQTCGPVRYERCNSHSCDIGWSAGEWEECSATCGENGYQERQLFCVPANISATTKRELIRRSVSPALCPTSKPDKTQPCNRIPCPVYWQEMHWTPCSTTCGRGMSYRPLFCPAPDVNLCGPKPREHRRHCRLRKCPRQPAPCPATDATQYCELFTSDQLERNCVVPPFRKYCCNACQLVRKRGD